MPNAHATRSNLSFGLLAFAPAGTITVAYLVAAIRQDPVIIAYGGVGAIIFVMAAIGCAIARGQAPHGDDRAG